MIDSVNMKSNIIANVYLKKCTYIIIYIIHSYLNKYIYVTYIYGYASINGSGTFRGDPHVWNGHFRKTSVPHVWNGVNWIMIISVYATSKASNDFALATKLFLHQVRFHGTVWKRSGTVWNRSGTVWNEVWNGIGRFAPNLGNGTGSKMFQLSCC